MTDENPIAAAEAEAESVSPPPTPEGYSDPYQFEYPKLPLILAGMALTVLFTVVYGVILVQLQGPGVLPVVFETLSVSTSQSPGSHRHNSGDVE